MEEMERFGIQLLQTKTSQQWVVNPSFISTFGPGCGQERLKEITFK
jgi:hypothetical protein